jgi:predicted nucleic-acid-binding protein
MKKFLVDTNCLLSFLTDRDQKQQELIQPFFEKAAGAEVELIILAPIKFELIYVLDKIYRIPKPQIRSIVIDLFTNPGITFANADENHAEMKIWPEKISDFTDAVLAQYAQREKISILTFDKNFIKQLKKQNIKSQPLK